MDSHFILVLSLAHIFVAVFATYLNISSQDRRLHTTAERDGKRLRAALSAELRQLHELCVENIERLEDSKPVLSLRASLFVYRGNIGRLHVLDESTLESIVATYALTDNVEHLLAATMIPSNNMFYKPAQPPVDVGVLIAKMEQVRVMTIDALSVMEEQAALSTDYVTRPAKLSWLSRSKTSSE
jgi:hypothetical protein